MKLPEIHNQSPAKQLQLSPSVIFVNQPTDVQKPSSRKWSKKKTVTHPKEAKDPPKVINLTTQKVNMKPHNTIDQTNKNVRTHK